MDITDNIRNIKKIYMSDSSLNMLLDFDRVLDNLDVYAFPNWLLGELVEGPTISKYWVKCKFMWPENLMPDPSGGRRLLQYGAKITYEKTTVKIPVKIESPADYRQGSKKGKLIETKVWYVDIMMPKNLMAEIKQGSVEIAGEDVDLSDLQSASEKDLTDKINISGSSNQPMTFNSGQAAVAPQMQAQGVPSVPPA